MTRTTIRSTVSALTAVVLVFMLVSGAVAGMRGQHMHDELVSGVKGHAERNSKSSEGLAARQGAQRSKPHFQPSDPDIQYPKHGF